MKVLVLSSLAFSLINFRGKLLEEMRNAGHEVVAVAPDEDRRVRARLEEIGVGFRTVSMARTGTNVLSDLRTIRDYVKLLREERPDAVVAYTQKPIIYGGIACRIVGVKRYYALMSGLGYLFSEAASDRRMLKRLFCQLYRAGLKGAKRIFVFNSDDRPDMITANIVDRSSPVVEVPGSGVDLDRFQHAPLPEGPIHFLMIGRLMRDKGVWEFAEAAADISSRHEGVRFSLIGRPEPSNPTGLNEADILRLERESPVEVIPETDDVPAFLASCHVFVLPTYYREGLPRTILEALAVGRAVVTTDTPGCRDAVTDGVNGFLVAPRDAKNLARAMENLVTEPGLVKQMSDRSRGLAEEVYDVRKVNALLMKEMELLGNGRASADIPDRSVTTPPGRPGAFQGAK
ncbi:glycosyltransferase family 4 protein [Aurantiacibacter hainanensis]|uniref:glycosyltransferase family 4 protein n=1 Tax=Aurantiacibacter hainanensis TaxID=3076114 RepID=UPI0030C6C7C9